MAITDLLSRIPIPPALRRSAPGPDPVPEAPDTDWMADAWPGYSAPAEFATPTAPREPRPAGGLPSWAVLAMAGLGLMVLALAAALLAVRAPAAPEIEIAVPTASADLAAPTPESPAPTTAFAADPAPVPTDVITRLEAASNEPLHGELSVLLEAIQDGFGSQSAQLDPALRSYTTRMASRFEWNPDTFRVAVTSPSAELAEARAGTLKRLFGAAVASRRLQIEPAAGPDALTLVSY